MAHPKCAFRFQVFALVVTLFVISHGVASISPLQTTRERGFPASESLKSTATSRPKFWANATEAALSRLPSALVPSHYELRLQPILDRNHNAFGIAFGSVIITVRCEEATNSVTLHASRKYVLIEPEATRIVHAITDQRIPIEDFEYVEEYDFFIIRLGENLVPGDEYYVMLQDFETTIATDRYDGLYLTQYQTPGASEPNLIAVTTFAASATRQAFPCFDEPALKATFDITIGRTQNFVALSNAEWVSTEEREPGWFFDTFATTVKMSTYLAIVFVAEYNFVEAAETLPGGKPVRIYAPPYMIDKNGGEYAAQLAQNVMTYFENYFEIDYKLEKYDSAAIPDFQFGAMENYGLVTYKTPFLMYFEGETTETERKRISSIVAHESSHQWFGNLITAKWWNHIWLNEGFASYLAPIGVRHTDSEFIPEKGFLNDVFQYSMPFDSDPNYAHPILSSDLITAPFYDRMNYEKAACLIRMMEGFLTPATLKKALQTFLRDFSFRAAGQDDLFAILTRQAHEDMTLAPDMTLKDVMDTWTMQAGFPLLRVTASGSSYVFISQERFVTLPENALDKRELNPNDLWTIPLTIATASDPDFSSYTPDLWLMKDRQLILHPHNTNEWIMLNVDATAYYRVLYDTSLTNRIIGQLMTNLDVISPLSRSQLFDDYFKSAALSHVNIETAFELTKYLGAERDPHVWDTVLTNLEPIYTMFMSNEGLAALRAYLVPKLEAVINDLGIDQLPSDRGNKVLHRLQLLDWACGMDSALCVNRAKELFAAWVSDPENPNLHVPLDLQPVYFCAAVSGESTGNTFWSFVLERYQNVDTPEHRRVYLLNALACSRSMPRVTELLEEIVNPSSTIFPSADARALLQRVVSNPDARLHAFNFIRDPANLAGLITKFGLNIVSETVATMATYTNTTQELADVENFVNDNADQFETIKPALDRALEKIQENVDWMTKFGTRIRNWLQSQNA